jgi:hypothetical protein
MVIVGCMFNCQFECGISVLTILVTVIYVQRISLHLNDGPDCSDNDFIINLKTCFFEYYGGLKKCMGSGWF